MPPAGPRRIGPARTFLGLPHVARGCRPVSAWGHSRCCCRRVGCMPVWVSSSPGLGIAGLQPGRVARQLQTWASGATGIVSLFLRCQETALTFENKQLKTRSVSGTSLAVQ